MNGSHPSPPLSVHFYTNLPGTRIRATSSIPVGRIGNSRSTKGLRFFARPANSPKLSSSYVRRQCSANALSDTENHGLWSGGPGFACERPGAHIGHDGATDSALSRAVAGGQLLEQLVQPAGESGSNGTENRVKSRRRGLVSGAARPETRGTPGVRQQSAMSRLVRPESRAPLRGGEGSGLAHGGQRPFLGYNPRPCKKER